MLAMHFEEKGHSRGSDKPIKQTELLSDTNILDQRRAQSTPQVENVSFAVELGKKNGTDGSASNVGLGDCLTATEQLFSTNCNGD